MKRYVGIGCSKPETTEEKCRKILKAMVNQMSDNIFLAAIRGQAWWGIDLAGGLDRTVFSIKPQEIYKQSSAGETALQRRIENTQRLNNLTKRHILATE
jgi:hypothetical protein